MSIFKNISNGHLYIQGFSKQGDGTLGLGSIRYLEKDEEFSGSNYYDRFTYAGLLAAGVDEEVAREEAVLEKIQNDGLAFSEIALNVPNNPKVYHVAIAPGGEQIFNFVEDLSGPAQFMTLETSENVSVYLNGNSDARIDVEANSSIAFSNNELLLNSIKVTNEISGAGIATLQIIVANVIW